ncbi:MAG: ABC transporter permease [Oscillospiraceae bacterium]|nr:ABC transporter permease [Oscillospiraceae bacterium]
MDNILIAFKNLSRRKSRSLLTIISITIGIMSVLVIGVISSTGQSLINNELDSLGLNGVTLSVDNKNPHESLINDDLDFIRKLSFIDSASPIITAVGGISNNSELSQAVLWGFDSGSDKIISLEILYGSDMNKSDISARTNVCLMDSTTAKLLFSRENAVGSKVLITINNITDYYTIVGIVSADSSILQNVMGDYIPNLIYLPYTTIQQYIGSDKISQIAIKFESKEESMYDTLGEKTVKAMGSYKSGTNSIKVENISKQRDKLSNMLNIINVVLSIIGSISLVVAGIGITTVMLVSVTERTKEIGIKKAIGAKSADIMKEFLIEAILLSVGGCLTGIILTESFIKICGFIMNYSLNLSLQQILSTLLISVICGIIFGVYPARTAAKMNPVDSLRRE